jgi:hypothetical protein
MPRRLLACSRSFIEELSFPDGVGDDVIEGILPLLELIPAVDQHVFRDAERAEGLANPLQLGPAVAIRSEFLVLDDEQVDIRVDSLVSAGA